MWSKLKKATFKTGSCAIILYGGFMRRMKTFIKNSRLYKKIIKANIKTKVGIYYIFILFVSLLFISVAYNQINASIIKRKSATSAQQTLEALDQNLNFVLKNISQCSDYIYFEDSVQSALKQSKGSGMDPSTQSVINKALVHIILSNNYISSVYLFDNYNNEYSTGKFSPSKVYIDCLKASPWYETVKKAQGAPIWIVGKNSDVFKRSASDLPVSLVRIVYDTDYYEPIGVLVINLNKSLENDIFGKIGSNFKSQFFIVDGSGNSITQTSESNNSIVQKFIKKASSDVYSENDVINGQNMILCSIKSKCSDWRIIGMLPLSKTYKDEIGTGSVIIIIILINIIFLTVGQFYLTILITRPLSRMKQYMVNVQNGKFEPIPIEKQRDDEIVRLKRVFNIMVEQIKTLIAKVKEEQQIIRLNEVNMLRAQINPHFLYNTLDAVSALTLIKDCDNAYTLTRSLENFYRTSLSSGNDIISINDEIDCIKNYITILKIRYHDSFDVEYNVSENILEKQILKLLLQPFVENSIVHGIHNKHGRGRIKISGYEKDGFVYFEIEDNGIGMSEEKIQEVLNKKSKKSKGGFGIYSSITRISLFYGIENPVNIKSRVNEGTCVTIRVPII